MAHAAVVEGLQEGGRGDAVGRLRSFDRQRPPGLRTQPQEHGVEIGADLRHSDVGADAAVHARLDPEVEDALYLGVQHVARRAKARNAITHHAAEFGAFIKQSHVVALQRQLVRRREAGRSAADHGHFLATLCLGLGVGQLVGDRVVAQKMFDRIDADEVLHLVAVAARLAGGRADPAHDGRKRIGFGQAPERVLLPLHSRGRLLDAAHDVEVTADVFTGRATALARRGALDVGRAFMRMVGVEDLLLPGARLVVAVLVAAKSQRLDGSGGWNIGHGRLPLGCGGAALSGAGGYDAAPSRIALLTSWCTPPTMLRSKP